MNFDLNSLINEFLEPKEQSNPFHKFTRKQEFRHELEKRRAVGQATKDLMESPAWQDAMLPKLQNSLKSGFGEILRATPQTHKETELWAIIGQMKANLSIVADLKWNIEAGDAASKKLESLK